MMPQIDDPEHRGQPEDTFFLISILKEHSIRGTTEHPLCV
jgi:hypothetical protein